jgi:hypothetical protein
MMLHRASFGVKCAIVDQEWKVVGGMAKLEDAYLSAMPCADQFKPKSVPYDSPLVVTTINGARRQASVHCCLSNPTYRGQDGLKLAQRSDLFIFARIELCMRTLAATG